ncbi:hypothetical protein [Micromonospora sp. WMMD736]|uniref:hypothetical protein n=1 Tax=Micromonospora sp. WMMD736 TaxID=3404112 RepID=UPI003B941519
MTVRSLAVHPSKHFRDRRELRRTPRIVAAAVSAARIVAVPARTDRGRDRPRDRPRRRPVDGGG